MEDTPEDIKNELEKFAHAVGCKLEIHYATSALNRKAWIRFTNKAGHKASLVNKEDNYHTTLIGEIDPDLFPKSYDSIDIGIKIKTTNDLVFIRAKEQLLSGKGKLRVSNTKKIDLPRASSFEELMLKLEIQGKVHLES